MEKAIVKWNNAKLALLCSKCKVIIKTGKDFTREELEYTMERNRHLDPQYCEKCKK